MSDTIPCVPCCSTTQTVNTPGTPGATGLSAFTVTSASFIVPALNGSVTIAVVSSAWAFVGQAVSIANVTATGDTYVVTAIPDATHLTIKYLNYGTNTNAAAVIAAGSAVSAGGFQPNAFTPLNPANNLSDVASVATALANLGLGVAPVTDYAVGGSQALTTTPSQALSKTITLVNAAKYLMFGTVRFDYVGATFAAPQTLTAKLRRTNNTPGDLPSAIANCKTQIITTLTYTAECLSIPVTYYTATGVDIIQPFVSVDVAPGAGSVQVIEASIVAVRLS